MLAKLGIK